MEHSFTTDQVAKYCHATRGSVVRWIREGRLKAAVTPGGHHRVLRQDLVEFLEAQKFPVPPELAPVDFEKPRVLIVEDDDSQRKLLKYYIGKRFPNFQIDEAADGFEAGLKVHRFRPNLVLLDIRLPGEDGLVVCRHIRSIEEFSNMVIIAMTGVHDPEVKQSALDGGANDFLWKPYEMNELEEKILKHFKEGNHGASHAAA